MLDNYGTHKHPEVRQWLAEPANQRIILHSTPTGCSWLNMVVRHEVAVRREALEIEGGARPPRWAVAAVRWELGAA